jgi:monofunctional biosynthetic peptidoglycan transglycosylase
MSSQAILRNVMMLFLGLLLVGCGNNALEISPVVAVNSELEVKDSYTTDITPAISETQSSSEPKGDDMITSRMEEKTALPGIEIFNFGSGEPIWYTVDDRVMGGVSRSTVEIIDSDILRFSGTMSLDSNGGFSSARSDWKPINLDGFDGILLRVLGDGNMYRLRIRTAETGSDISYNAIFETSLEEWQLVYIPFQEMVPTYRGFVMNVEPLDPASIGSFGFMLSDKQPGEFDLQVDWIRAVTEEALLDYRSN